VDDLHHLRTDADPAAYAGRAWIEVFGSQNQPSALCEALRHGLFYSSSGASIRRIAVTQTTYSVWPKAPGARVLFIGREGRLLGDIGPLPEGGAGVHALAAGNGYVRAKVVDPDGAAAWTPAVFEAK
jgi:hypothetical protein